SPRRFAAEIWDAVIHGARGVFYFSARIKVPCSSGCLLGYDDTPDDVVQQMKETDALLTKLAPVLQRAIDPDSASMTGPGALEIGWRHDPDAGAYYFLVLNPNDAHEDGVHLDLHGVHTGQPVKVVEEG